MSAWVIAARNESGPESFVFRTVIVAGTTRPSSDSKANARAGSRRRSAPRRRAAADPHRDHSPDTIRTPIDSERTIGLPSISKRIPAATIGPRPRRGPALRLDRPDPSGTIRLSAQERHPAAVIPAPPRARRSGPHMPG